MIHHHALRDVDAIIALHVDPTRSVGCVGLRYGILTASCDAVHVRFIGKGGHGARPQLANDPIDAATHWVQSAYRRIGRTANPHSTVVFSIGHIEGGHSANVIPNSASLSGTLRSLDQESRQTAWETLEDICEAIERETRVKVEMAMGSSAPAVINDKGLVDLLSDAASDALSPGAIEWIDEPSMGSEDFSYYLELIPGAMFRLGVAGDQKQDLARGIDSRQGKGHPLSGAVLVGRLDGDGQPLPFVQGAGAGKEGGSVPVLPQPQQN